MTCDRYEHALLAAASDGEMDARLARHLERCSKCRVTLRSERELLSRIDSVLRAQVNEDPRPGFMAQFRLRLSKEPAARPQSDRVGHVAGAALALILIAMLYPLFNPLFNPLSKTRQSSVQGNMLVPAIQVLQIAGVTKSARASGNFGVGSRHHSKRPAVQNAAPPEPEVLVPPDEQKAFAQFVARVAGRDAMAEAAVSPAADKPLARNTELPGVSSVDMAALQFHGAEQGKWMAEWMTKTDESE